MTLLLQTISADRTSTRALIEPGRNNFRAQPGMQYRVIDDAGARIDQNVLVRRLGNDLVIDGLPDGSLIELEGFFIRCTPRDSCALAMDTLGGSTPAAQVTPMTEPVVALKDGSFLMYATQPVATILPAGADAPEAGTWFKPVGYGLAGIAVLGAAGGGGGSGGGATSASALTPSVPVVSSGAASKSLRPVFSGQADAGSTVNLFLDIDGNNTFPVRFTAVADNAGNWTINTATANPVSGAMHDIATNSAVAVRVLAVGVGGSQSGVNVFTLVVDASAPDAPVISDDIAAVVTAGPITFRLAFAEPVTGLTADSIHVSGGSAGALTMVDPTHYTLVVTPTPATQAGNITVAVPAGGFGDALGNLNASAVSASQAFDTLAPAAPVITDNVAGATAGSTTTFTLKFGEAPAPSSLTLGDLVVSGGSAGGLVQLDATTYAVAVTPNANSTGTMTVAIGAGSFTDLAGNISTGSASQSQAFDTRGPTLSITDNRPAALTNVATTFSFTLSQTPGSNGFDASDIAVSGGTAGAFTRIDATHYSLLVTPTANVNAGTMTVNVGAGAFNNAVGAPSGAASASQSYDTLAPTETLGSFSILQTPGNTAIAYNGTTTDSTPQVTLNLNSVLASGDVMSILRSTDGGAATVVSSLTAGSSSRSFTDSLVVTTHHNYVYTAQIVDAVGNVAVLDLNGAVAGSSYLIHT